MIRLALVKFPNESPGTYVIPVKDILDLVSPKSTTDFLPNHLYNIKWPVEARQHSDTTEDEFGGFVLLLAGLCGKILGFHPLSSPLTYNS